jgi:hypothetical protein
MSDSWNCNMTALRLQLILSAHWQLRYVPQDCFVNRACTAQDFSDNLLNNMYPVLVPLSCMSLVMPYLGYLGRCKGRHALIWKINPQYILTLIYQVSFLYNLSSMWCHRTGFLFSWLSSPILHTWLLVLSDLYVLLQRTLLQNWQRQTWIWLVLSRVSRGLACMYTHNNGEASVMLVAVHRLGILRIVSHKYPCNFQDRCGRFACVCTCPIGWWCAVSRESWTFSCIPNLPYLFQGNSCTGKNLHYLLLLCWWCYPTVYWMRLGRLCWWWCL